MVCMVCGQSKHLLFGRRRELHAGVGGRRFTIVIVHICKPRRYGGSVNTEQRTNSLLRPPPGVRLAKPHLALNGLERNCKGSLPAAMVR